MNEWKLRRWPFTTFQSCGHPWPLWMQPVTLSDSRQSADYVLTSRQYWDNFTGYQYGNALSLRWPFWYTRHWMVCHHSTWRMTVNSSQPLAACDFDRLMLLPLMFHKAAQLWEIDSSLLLVLTCGTIYHFISVTLNYHFLSFASYWKRICLAEDHGA